MVESRAPQPDAIGVVEHEIMLLLRLAESARKDAVTLDRSAYLLLYELASRGAVGIAALADTFQVDLSTASRQAAALETKGLVQRRPDPGDARVSLLEATALGEAQFQAAHNAYLVLFADLLEDWPKADCQRFGAYLARLNQTIVRRRRRQATAARAHPPL